MKELTQALVLALLATGSLLTGCTSQSRLQQTEEEKRNLQRQTSQLDSLSNRNRQLEQDVMTTDGYYKTAMQDLEQCKGTNKGLFANLKELQEKYDRIIDQRGDFMSTSSYEKMSLTEQLTAYQQQLDEKERNLRNLEWELAQKEENLNRLQQMDSRGVAPATGAGSDQTFELARYQLQQKRLIIQQLRSNVTQAMASYPPAEFSMAEQTGKLYLIINQSLLFPTGTIPDQRGLLALRQLAGALRDNGNIQITVESHTDTNNTPAQAWDLTAMQASAVARELALNGIEPFRLTAAGRGFYQPVGPNNTDIGRAANRRIVIIVSPNYDEVIELLMPPGN